MIVTQLVNDYIGTIRGKNYFTEARITLPIKYSSLLAQPPRPRQPFTVFSNRMRLNVIAGSRQVWQARCTPISREESQKWSTLLPLWAELEWVASHASSTSER